jgi:hypothetical protein
MHTGIWFRNPQEKDHLEDLGVERRNTLTLVLKKENGKEWTRPHCLSIQVSRRFLFLFSGCTNCRKSVD